MRAATGISRDLSLQHECRLRYQRATTGAETRRRTENGDRFDLLTVDEQRKERIARLRSSTSLYFVLWRGSSALLTYPPLSPQPRPASGPNHPRSIPPFPRSVEKVFSSHRLPP